MTKSHSTICKIAATLLVLTLMVTTAFGLFAQDAVSPPPVMQDETIPLPDFWQPQPDAALEAAPPDAVFPPEELPEQQETAASAETVQPEETPPGLAPEQPPPPESEEQWQERQHANRAERVMKAFAAAYPGTVGPAEERGGDWCVTVHGVTFFYCNGRLLPESLRLRGNEYDPQPFYSYPAELPLWKVPSPEETARMKGWSDSRNQHPPKRSPLFFDALWSVHNRKEAEENLRTITFLDREVAVHRMIVEPLSKVDARIKQLSRTNPAVRNWVKNLRALTCWNWRNIAATQSRSFHSYGAALDLEAPAQRGMETYWLWSSQNGRDWWAVPYTQRLHPPKEIVRAFEENGFCWGGKWPMYDTMHFEYRPEILIYNGLPAKK